MSEPKTQPTGASVEDFLAAVEPARRREERHLPARDMLEIGEQAACRRQLGAAEAAEAVERRDAEMRLQSALAFQAGEIMAGAQDRGLGERVGAVRLDEFARGQSRDLGGKIGIGGDLL